MISVSGSDRGYPKVDLRRGIDPSCLFCLSAFAAKKCQGEVEPFNFAPPAFGDCAFTAGKQICFEFVEARQHFRIKREHRASQASVFVLAGGAVRASAGAQLDRPFVEVFLKLRHFGLGGLAVFTVRALGSAMVEELLVVADDIFFKDGHVAPSRLHVQVAQKGRADVNGQPIVHQVGREQSTEIVRGEPDIGEFWVRGNKSLGGTADQVTDHGRRHGPRASALQALEQVGKRFAPIPLGLVITRADRDSAVPGHVPADHLGDDVEQLCRHGDDAFAVTLGGADDQQGNDLTVGALVLPDAEMSQLDQLLSPKPGQAERLHDRPLPERHILLMRQPQQFPGIAIDHADCLADAPGLLVVVSGRGPLPGDALNDEPVAEPHVPGRIKEGAQMLPVAGDVLRQQRQQRLAIAGAVGHAFSQAPAAETEPTQAGVTDWAWSDPACPSFRFSGRPRLQIQVEGTDSQKRPVDVCARFPVAANKQPLLPFLNGLFVQAQVSLAGIDFFDDLPEVLDQVPDEVVQGRVVDLERAAANVVDQQVTDPPLRS